MGYRTAFPIIYSADVRRALSFYRDALGFAETFRLPSGSGDPEFVSLVLADSTGVALAKSGPSLHGRPVQPGAGGFELCIYTDDVDESVVRLRDLGCPVLVEPVDQPWDERLAYVADPDGNPIMICAPIRREVGTASPPAS